MVILFCAVRDSVANLSFIPLAFLMVFFFFFTLFLTMICTYCNLHLCAASSMAHIGTSPCNGRRTALSLAPFFSFFD